jgi:hypothetical protein
MADTNNVEKNQPEKKNASQERVKRHEELKKDIIRAKKYQEWAFHTF